MDAQSGAIEDVDPSWAPLIDVSGLSVVAMVADEDSALSRSVRRLIQDLDDPNGVICAFSSFAS